MENLTVIYSKDRNKSAACRNIVPRTTPGGMKMKSTTGSRIWAACCYFPPLFGLLHFIKRKDTLVSFHARQAMWVWLLFVLSLIISVLPGQFLAVIKWPVAITAALLFVYLLSNGIVDALKGVANPLPPFGEFVQRKNLFSGLRK